MLINLPHSFSLVISVRACAKDLIVFKISAAMTGLIDGEEVTKLKTMIKVFLNGVRVLANNFINPGLIK